MDTNGGMAEVAEWRNDMYSLGLHLIQLQTITSILSYHFSSFQKQCYSIIELEKHNKHFLIKKAVRKT